MLNMGPTIFAGFASSVTAGLFLFVFSATPFFNKMGTALSITVLYSVLAALVYLPCVLLLIGPSRNQGNVMKLLSKR